jgi:carbon monoxide dehydrogenase subunit G
MPEASNEVTIERPPEAVFDFLANAENDGRWRSGVLSIERQSGEGVGTRYRQLVKGPGGRRAKANIEITELEPGRRIGFRTTSGPVRPTGRYELEPSNGGTRVRLTLSAELGGLKRMLLSNAVGRAMTTEVGALDELKRVLERP